MALNLRHALLEKLKSKESSHRYSRYSGLPLRYAGGKSLAVGHIVEVMPDGINEMVSPFFGGGSVEIACAKELGVNVKGFDIFDILVNYWNVQIENPIPLATKLMDWQSTQDVYDNVKNTLRAHWLGEKVIDDDLELAAHYWFNHNLSYGPGFLGWMSKIYHDENRFCRLVGKVRNFRCRGLSVNRGSFEDVIPEHNDTFLYCDPPYYLDGDSKMFRGIYPQRNFPVHHDGFRHDTLRDLLKAHKGGFVLSYNDCETIREWYSDFDIVEVEWQYTLGQGETRIGKNREDSHVKQSHEILIVRHP